MVLLSTALVPLIWINGRTGICCLLDPQPNEQGEHDVKNKFRLLGLVAMTALLTAAPLSLRCSPQKSLTVSLDRAEARVGRPLTPMSVAGVNRRVHRRAYYGAAAAGAAAYGAATYRRCGYYPYPPCY
jgi:hypothetical protein